MAILPEKITVEVTMVVKNLKQGDRIEFMWYGSANLYIGRIETRDGDTNLYFVNEHCYDGDSINPEDESMRFYNPLDTFGIFTHFKILNGS